MDGFYASFEFHNDSINPTTCLGKTGLDVDEDENYYISGRIHESLTHNFHADLDIPMSYLF